MELEGGQLDLLVTLLLEAVNNDGDACISFEELREQFDKIPGRSGKSQY